MSSFRICHRLQDIPADDWDALHDGGNPFLAHAFLSGLEQHACLSPRYGWSAEHLLLYDGDTLIGAAPGYRKGNSHGEFVFDHPWAQAYTRAGLDYFPKWLNAVPYSPVSGPRLLAKGDALQRMLLDAVIEHTQSQAYSSAHSNFLRDEDLDAFDPRWLARGDVQFHWRNTVGWNCFDDFLVALNHKKRKNLLAERRAVAKAGIVFRIADGNSLRDGDVRDMHALYCKTQWEKGNHPAMSLAFFEHLAQAMPSRFVLILAEHAGRTIAGALCLRGGDTLYGRYWGAELEVSGLHFETCYHQGIEYCLREGLSRFEPGAQGEHKIARGFLPVLTHSRHYVHDPRFRAALQDWCAAEREGALRYRDEVLCHSPFRRSD